MPRNDGKEAERAFEDHWARVGHLERFWDQADLRGRNGGQAVGDFPKPADYLVSAPGIPLHYAEVKSTTHATRFAFGCIRKSQSAAALKSHARGDGGYKFYIFSYQLGKWFYMSCAQYADVLKAGEKSIKFEELTPWDK